jgi:hypothetical protein
MNVCREVHPCRTLVRPGGALRLLLSAGARRAIFAGKDAFVKSDTLSSTTGRRNRSSASNKRHVARFRRIECAWPHCAYFTMPSCSRVLYKSNELTTCTFRRDCQTLRFARSSVGKDPDRTAAEDCLRRGLAVAEEQDAKMWELRSATSLARLWRGGGRRREAHDLLAPISSWFTKGSTHRISKRNGRYSMR